MSIALGCEHNCGRIGNKIELYAKKHNGLYPASMSDIKKENNFIPSCPSSRKEYTSGVTLKFEETGMK